jgi:hypothetical protein
MNDIKRTAVLRAEAMLRASGAQFKIIHNDYESGDLVVAKPTIRKRGPAQNAFKHLYLDAIRAMKPCDVHEWQHDQPEKMRSAVSAAAHARWGNGNAMTEVRGTTVTLLRVA